MYGECKGVKENVEQSESKKLIKQMSVMVITTYAGWVLCVYVCKT